MKKNFQGLKIAKVKEKLTSYRIHLNDNSIIDLPRNEIGEVVPKPGMFVRYGFYGGLILQKIELDGNVVLSRSALDIMFLTTEINEKIEEDVQKLCEGHEDIILDSLEYLFRFRIDMIKYIAKTTSNGNIFFESLEYEISRCSMAEILASQGLARVLEVEKMDLSKQQKVLAADIEKEMIDEIISMAKAYLVDKANFDTESINFDDLRQSNVLAEWSCIFDFEKDTFEELRNAYITDMKN